MDTWLQGSLDEDILPILPGSVDINLTWVVELKSRLMRVKEESQKANLKLNIQKSKIMASGPITSQKIDGENMETVTDFIFLDAKITVNATEAMKFKDAYSMEGELWQT